MIKVFTLNKNGKIELSEAELKKILDDAYWEGYRDHGHSWTYTTPNWTPYYYTTCSTTGGTSSSGTITLTSSNTTVDSTLKNN